MKKKLIEADYYEVLYISMPVETAFDWTERIKSGDMQKFRKFNYEECDNIAGEGLLVYMYDDDENLKQELIALAKHNDFEYELSDSLVDNSHQGMCG